MKTRKQQSKSEELALLYTNVDSIFNAFDAWASLLFSVAALLLVPCLLVVHVLALGISIFLRIVKLKKRCTCIAGYNAKLYCCGGNVEPFSLLFFYSTLLPTNVNLSLVEKQSILQNKLMHCCM